MNPLEVRTQIRKALAENTGDAYGQIRSVTMMPPEDTGASVGMRLTVNDPTGQPRRYVVLISEI